jgi:hypothetical protein
MLAAYSERCATVCMFRISGAEAACIEGGNLMGKWREINFFAQQVTVPPAVSSRASRQRIDFGRPLEAPDGHCGCELLATFGTRMAIQFQFEKLHGLRVRGAVTPMLRIVWQRRSKTMDRYNSA